MVNPIVEQKQNSGGRVKISTLILLLILCGLVSTVIGLGIGLLFNITLDKNLFNNGVPTQTAMPTPEEDGPPTLTPEATTMTGDKTEWVNYKNEEYQFSLKYPKGWTIEGPILPEYVFEISNQGYTFLLRRMLGGWGPEGCVYSDTSAAVKESLEPLHMYMEYDNFTQIEGTKGITFRRTLDKENNEFIICSGENFKVGDSMGESVEAQKISYQVPEGTLDPKMLSLLDQILISFEMDE